jgi:exodeoxyribonuclease VII large subunit
MQSHILTVTQLTARIKDLIEGAFPDVWVEGELSNLGVPQSGHAYFTLKDEQCQVRAVLFRSSQRHLKFTLQQGLRLICRGRVSVYEPRGEYQFIVDYLEPKGVGALQLAFEQLKTRLEKEGLFDPGRKKKLPLLPRRIGVITSPTGAAIRDILRVIERRHPRIRLLLYPAPVQGEAAASAIVEALRYFNRKRAADVLIVGRGGGSLEDLAAFNDESVARAIAASRIPVISAVGHETDYTISDFASDLRAPTPSAAAEMVVESEEHFLGAVRSLEAGIVRGMQWTLERARSSLREAMRILGDPRRGIERRSQRLDELTRRLGLQMGRSVLRERSRLEALTTGLNHLNPLGVLSRGYGITSRLPGGEVVADAATVRVGELLCTKLHRGDIISRVERTSKDRQ